MGKGFIKMPKGTPQSAGQKWLRNIQGSGQTATDGANSVTEAPGVKAAAQQEKMLRNLTESVTSGRWARNVSAVSLSDWKRAYIEKGIPAMARGAQLAQPKMVAYLTEAYPVIAAMQQEIDAMPDGSLQDSISRSAAWITMASERLKK